MTQPAAPPHPDVPVTGTDWFLHAFDQGMQRRGDQGNVCHLVLRLDTPLDPNQLDKAVHRATWLHDLAALRLRHGLLRRPTWRPDPRAPAVEVRRATLDSLETLAEALPTRPIDLTRDAPLWLTHLRAPDGDAVVLTFHHAAMDARGAELTLARLGGLLPTPRPDEVQLAVSTDPRTLGARLRSAKLARDSVLRFSLGPLRYLAPRRLTHPARLRYRRFTLTAAQTLTVTQTAQAHGASLGAAAFLLVAVARALRDATAQRVPAGGDFLVPMPLDRRARNALGPLLGNQVSLLFYRLDRNALDDLTASVRAVLEQMRSHVRSGLPEAFETLLGMCRALPAGLLRAIVSLPTLGRMASFGFSDTGSTLQRLDRFLDLPVTDAWHLPGNLHPPGVTVICSRHGGRLSFSLAWLHGTLSDAELRDFEAGLRSLLGL